MKNSFTTDIVFRSFPPSCIIAPKLGVTKTGNKESIEAEGDRERVLISKLSTEWTRALKVMLLRPHSKFV